ncbi:hypothetical protein [Leptodesmis sp.]|uniref:hypothetical protein n=1 Tax=Leptodesmis sp. TaxID=3100501 RepID=UPI00405351CE
MPVLEAHAYLSLLSPNVQLNAKLIDKGYFSMATIASTPRSTFVAHLKDDLPTLQAESLYQQAVLQMNSFGNILTNVRPIWPMVGTGPILPFGSGSGSISAICFPRSAAVPIVNLP